MSKASTMRPATLDQQNISVPSAGAVRLLYFRCSNSNPETIPPHRARTKSVPNLLSRRLLECPHEMERQLRHSCDFFLRRQSAPIRNLLREHLYWINIK